MPALKKSDHILTIFFLTLVTFVLLFIFRSYDDNRLTSWQWVFNATTAWKVYLLVIAGIPISYLLSRKTFIWQGYKTPWVLFIASFVLSAVFWREPEVIVDGGRYFTQAKHLEMYGIGYFIEEWGRGIFAWTDMPLVPFLYGLIFKLLGESRLYIQIFTTLMFSLTIVLTYLIGKDLYDREVGLAGGALLMGMPYLYTQVPLMLVDVPAMFFLTLSIFTFINALNQGGVWIGFSSITIFLAFFSKYSTWLMLSVLVIIFLVYLKIAFNPSLLKGVRGNLYRNDFRRILYRWLLTFFVAILLVGAGFLYKYDVFREQIRLLVSYQRPGLERWTEGFISTFLFQVHPFISAFAVYSIYIALRKRDLRYVIISWLILLVVLMGIRRIRYLIPVFPMLALMAGYGLREIKTDGLRRFIVSSAVVFSLVVAIFVYLPFLEKMSETNLKSAGKFLGSLNVTQVEVFTLPQRSSVNPAVSVPLLDIFVDKRILYNPMDMPPPSDIEKSSLRFTWEYKNPNYYVYDAGGIGENTPVVIISEGMDSPLPPYIKERVRGYHNMKEFNSFTDVFWYRTIVKVFY